MELSVPGGLLASVLALLSEGSEDGAVSEGPFIMILLRMLPLGFLWQMGFYLLLLVFYVS